MKKIYSLIFATAISFFSFNSTAATVNVLVGVNTSFSPANEFTPPVLTCNVGDVVQFVLGAGIHNVTSTSIPAGAAAMSSGTMSTLGQMYNYTVTLAGTYLYTCTFHGGMNGTLIVSGGLSVASPTVDLLTTVYPNPFKDKVMLKYNGIESVELFNIIGEKVKTFELSSLENKVEIELFDLTAGVYFIRTFKEGVIVETKKIVKSK